MPEPSLPDVAVRAAEQAIREHVRIHLNVEALAQAAQGQPVILSGREAETAARAAVEAAAPLIAEQTRREVAAEFRALAARYRAVPDDGLTFGQLNDRDEQAAECDRIANKIASPESR